MEGWTHDEERGMMIPPGWVRADDMEVVDGGPRGMAERHCPHCGGGLALRAGAPEDPAGLTDGAISA